jgi:ATP-binding cassette, subfamily B (MDR/TAP), member 1
MLLFVYLAIVALAVGTMMSVAWNVSAEMQAAECRRQYFRSIIRQEMAWFDTHQQTQIINSFAADTLSFEQAIG